MGTLHLERSRRTMRKFAFVVCLTVLACAEAGAEANAEADADSFYNNFPNSLRYSGFSFRNVNLYDLNRIREFLNRQQEFNGQFLGSQNSQFQQRQFEGQQNQPGQFSAQPQTLQPFQKSQDQSNKKQQQFVSLSLPLNPSQNKPYNPRPSQFDLDQYSHQFNPQNQQSQFNINQQSQHQGNQQFNPMNQQSQFERNQQSQFQGYQQNQFERNQQNQFQRNQQNQFEGQQYEQRQFPTQPQFHANQKQQQFVSQPQQPFNPTLSQNNFSQKFSNPQGSQDFNGQFNDQNSQQFNLQFQENLQSQFDGQQQYQQRQFSTQPQLQTYQQKTHDQAHQDQFVSQRRQQFNQDLNRVAFAPYSTSVSPSNMQEFRNGVNGF